MSLKSACKSAVHSVFRVLAPGLSGASILMYHSIGDNGAHFTVTPKDFAWQMRYLAKTRKVVSLAELVERMKTGQPLAGLVVITFDDGYRDNLTYALPVLEQYGLPATIFVITGKVGSSFRNKSGSELEILDESELAKLAAHPLIDLMPHSTNHPKLTEVSLEEAGREIEGSRMYLEQKFGKPAKLFAYPKGRFNSDITKYLASHDWDAAVSTIEGVVHHGDDLFTLKRNAVSAPTTRAEFKAKLGNAIGLYAKMRT